VSGIALQQRRSQEFTKGPLFVEILDQRLERVGSVVVAGDGTETVELAPGAYLLRVRRPSAPPFFHSVDVPSGGVVPVELMPLDTSPHEFLQYEHHLGLVRTVDLLAMPPKPRLQGWLRVWRVERAPDPGAHASFRPTALPVMPLAYPNVDDDAARFTLTPEREAVRWVEICARGHRPHVAVLPPGDRPVTIALTVPALRIDAPSIHQNEDVGVIVSGIGEGPEALLRYFTSNNVDASRLLAERLGSEIVPRGAQVAEEMLFHKAASPLAAAIGGYYLLRVNAFDQLHDWPRNLDDWFPWFADGAVVRASQLLADPKEPDPITACERLVEATARGLPAVTEGVRLLRDGLTYFARIFPWRGRKRGDLLHEAAVRALSWLTPYLDAIDWRSPLTVFEGRSPLKPARDLEPTSIPEGEQVYEW
jgi:hypothetical protein